MDFSRVTEQISKIKVKNVVDMPLFYALFVLALALISAICKVESWVTIILFTFAAVLVFVAVFGYLFFSLKDPSYLRSEEFHLRKQSLEILGDKDNMLPVNSQHIVDITNPYPLQITEDNTR